MKKKMFDSLCDYMKSNDYGNTKFHMTTKQ